MANVLSAITKIQQLWLNEIPKHIDFAGDNTPLPDNVKAAISQADKKDQRRESLILIAQMQALLDKPQPPELDPQLEEIPEIKDYSLLISQEKGLNEVCNPILNHEHDSDSSIIWEALHKRKIIIRPSAYFYYLNDSVSDDKRIFCRYLPFSIYEPWRYWWFKATDRLPNFKNLFKMDKYKFSDGWRVLKYHQPQQGYDLLYQLLELSEEKINELKRFKDPFENILSALRDDLSSKDIEYLQQKQKAHYSEDVRQKIATLLDNIEEKKEKEKKEFQNIINNLTLKDGRLFEAKEKSYYHLNEFALHQKLADHFGLTIDQLIDAWGVESFLNTLSNHYFFKKIMRFNPSQACIDRAYLRLCKKVANLIKQKGYPSYQRQAAQDLCPYVSYEVKHQVDMSFVFDENIKELDKYLTLENIIEMNDTFGSNLTDEQLSKCLIYKDSLFEEGIRKIILNLPKQHAEIFLQKMLDPKRLKPLNGFGQTRINLLRFNLHTQS